MPRATVPVLGAVLLVGVTVLLAVALSVMATGFAPPEPAGHLVVEVSADAASGRVTLVHVAGPAIDVRSLSLRVEIDDVPLTHQPPVPFAAAAGFNGFPTGPFNPAAEPTWEAGEAGSFRIAGTNEPQLQPGAVLTVTVHRDGLPVARATTTVA